MIKGFLNKTTLTINKVDIIRILMDKQTGQKIFQQENNNQQIDQQKETIVKTFSRQIDMRTKNLKNQMITKPNQQSKDEQIGSKLHLKNPLQYITNLTKSYKTKTQLNQKSQNQHSNKPTKQQKQLLHNKLILLKTQLESIQQSLHDQQQGKRQLFQAQQKIKQKIQQTNKIIKQNFYQLLDLKTKYNPCFKEITLQEMKKELESLRQELREINLEGKKHKNCLKIDKLISEQLQNKMRIYVVEQKIVQYTNLLVMERKQLAKIQELLQNKQQSLVKCKKFIFINKQRLSRMSNQILKMEEQKSQSQQTLILGKYTQINSLRQQPSMCSAQNNIIDLQIAAYQNFSTVKNQFKQSLNLETKNNQNSQTKGQQSQKQIFQEKKHKSQDDRQKAERIGDKMDQKIGDQAREYQQIMKKQRFQKQLPLQLQNQTAYSYILKKSSLFHQLTQIPKEKLQSLAYVKNLSQQIQTQSAQYQIQYDKVMSLHSLQSDLCNQYQQNVNLYNKRTKEQKQIYDSMNKFNQLFRHFNMGKKHMKLQELKREFKRYERERKNIQDKAAKIKLQVQILEKDIHREKNKVHRMEKQINKKKALVKDYIQKYKDVFKVDKEGFVYLNNTSKK